MKSSCLVGFSIEVAPHPTPPTTLYTHTHTHQGRRALNTRGNNAEHPHWLTDHAVVANRIAQRWYLYSSEGDCLFTVCFIRTCVKQELWSLLVCSMHVWSCIITNKLSFWLLLTLKLPFKGGKCNPRPSFCLSVISQLIMNRRPVIDNSLTVHGAIRRGVELLFGCLNPGAHPGWSHVSCVLSLAYITPACQAGLGPRWLHTLLSRARPPLRYFLASLMCVWNMSAAENSQHELVQKHPLIDEHHCNLFPR